MKLLHALFLLLGLAIIAVAGTLGYARYAVLETKTLPMDLTVADTLAFNLDTDAIHFGKIPAGFEGIKNVTITNNRGIPVRAEITADGALAAWLGVDATPVLIQPRSNHTVVLTASVPKETPLGKYEGTLIVRFKRAR